MTVTRIDKWLWHARFCRTRAIAQEKAAEGHIRINGHRVEKPSHPLRLGDIVTLPALGRVIVVRVLALAERRGPATSARELYEVLPEPGPRATGTGEAVAGLIP